MDKFYKILVFFISNGTLPVINSKGGDNPCHADDF
jgi:hypothetical protein